MCVIQSEVCKPVLEDVVEFAIGWEFYFKNIGHKVLKDLMRVVSLLFSKYEFNSVSSVKTRFWIWEKIEV